MTRLLAGLAAGYLIGSIPFAVLAARALSDFDVRRGGTGNPGATNVYQNVGPIAGAAVALLDFLKAILPAYAATGALGLEWRVGAAIAVGAVLGHDFSVFLGFRGGKGGASTVGAFGFLDPWALMMSGLVLAVFHFAWRGRRFTSGPAALSTFPIFAAWHASPWGEVLAPVWGPRTPAMAPILGVGLALLLWQRIVPGLRRAGGVVS